ncbi:hypothetical protein ACHAW6_013086, partial [Cyclotella cf. meneghiniana]
EEQNRSFTRLGFPRTSRHQRHRVTFFDWTHLAELISSEQFRIFKVLDIPVLDFGPYFQHNFKRFSPSKSFRPTTTIVVIIPTKHNARPTPPTMTTRHQCEQTEINYVAEAFNWEQRIKGENDAARQWPSNWSSVFAPDMPKTNSEKIERLTREMSKLPVCAMMSNSQMSYVGRRGYKELGRDYRRKRSWEEDF